MRIKKIPYYTYLISLICVVLFSFVIYYSHFTEISIRLYDKFGAPNANVIYNGHYYGLITNSLVHANFVHLGLNIIAFILLGAFVEKRIPTYRFIIFGIYFSMITSLWQLSISGDAGLGLSGVNMSLMGFIFGKGIYDKKFQLPFRFFFIILAVLVILFCMLLDYLYTRNIGNTALISGLICGTIVGIFSVKKINVSLIALSLIGLISISTLFYSPWSSEWNFYKGNSYHQEGDIINAKKYYTKTLEINPKNELAKANLLLLRVDELSNLAYEAHSKALYALARKYYLEILAIDKNNAVARQNIRGLP